LSVNQPDITYLLDACRPEGKATKKIVGLLLTHGHEDHIGGLPFILPQLPSFPLYGSPLTAALANEKLTEFNLQPAVQTITFTNGNIHIGDFKITFIHVTHSIPDTAHLFIETPAGNFYHGADYKFDLTPADRKRTEFLKITQVAQKGITALISDCLGAERPGFTPSEEMLTQNFEKTMRESKGKVVITTNSSNVSRLNQAIEAAEKLNRKVSGEELESYVVRDRERLAQEGVVILLVEINASNSQLAGKPEVIMRGTSLPESKENLTKLLQKEIEKVLSNQKGHVTNWVHIRRVIGDVAERHIFKNFHSRPLVLPVVVEV
jgi:mRNA degradation ribonuclease J1/J2